MTSNLTTNLKRFWRSVIREPYTGDRRSRLRVVMNNLILHIHPAQVPTRALRFTYTWGLGGLSALLVVLLAVTGSMLLFHYTPSPDAAYNSILALQTDVWFGALVRNLHHWAGNLLLVVAFLHLLRVFFTGAFRPPREFNWLLGISLLLLVVVSNFTGYLLPWDQLAYWGITVGISILSYIPVAGAWISRLLLGGPEIGAATLLNFYALHIAVIPMAMLFIMSYHFWRVRKDGFSIPRTVAEPPVERVEKSMTMTDLVRPEAVMATVAIAALTIWSMAVAAPLEPLANPAVSPNPAKAPWYFMGIQELLLHFHPLVGAIILPAVVLFVLAALPYLDTDMDAVGIYFRSRRGRWLSLFSFLWGVLITLIYVIVDEFFLDWAALFPGLPSLIANGLVPFALLWLGIIGYFELTRRATRATRCEAILATFVLMLAGFITLTVVGVFFRGPGMALIY
ncbi:MAG: cytochrome b N-terminal domain-containing protein [Anaerolineae bacterium]|nr:cytochrome b N-terminal domain-containing protein [Anaerolineae bacterium]